MNTVYMYAVWNLLIPICRYIMILDICDWIWENRSKSHIPGFREIQI